MDQLKRKRIMLSLVGVIVCGVSVGVFKTAAFGVDPFQSLMGGFDQLIPLGFGTLYVLVNAVLLLFSLFVDRHNLGIATIINLLLVGYIVEFVYGQLQLMFESPALWVRVVLLVLALFIMCIGSSLYMTADLGVSTYDAIARVCAEKWKLAPFSYCRIATDFTCVVLGAILCLLGGGTIQELLRNIGIGTILTAFCMGPLIAYFNRTIARPFLEK